VQRGQPVLGELRHDPLPLDARSDPHAPRTGVDRDLLELADVDQEHIVERSERIGVVAGRLRRDPQPVVGGVPDRGDDVVDAPGQRHGGGPQVHRQVEDLADGVPVGIRGGDDAPGHRGGQIGEWGGGEHCFAFR
jgi:hypothetical protein